MRADATLLPARDWVPSSALSVLHRPPGVRDRYAGIALVSHSDHLALVPNDSETLIVSTDWIAWRRAVMEGRAAVHYEHALAEWPAAMGDPDAIYLRSCNWMYVDGRDVTMFQGVSLGKIFNWHVGATYLAALRLHHGLDLLIREFRPHRILSIDMRTEFDFVDRPSCERIVAGLARQHQVALELAHAPRGADYMDLHPFGEAARETAGRVVLRRLYEIGVGALSTLTQRTSRPGVYIHQNPLVVGCLLEGFHGRKLRPVLLARQYRKSVDFVVESLRRGIDLAQLPAARLTAAERGEIARMRERLERAWQTPSSPIEEACRNLIRTQILGRFAAHAAQAKAFSVLFRRRRVRRVVVGDAVNPTARILLEIAARERIPVDEMPNGMFLSYMRMDARCGDGLRPPLVSRLLSWGSSNDRWYAIASANIPTIRTGYPLVAQYRRAAAPPAPRAGRALVLPLQLDRGDALGLYSETFGTLIETVRALRDTGYHDIRVKVHPGHQNLRYYREALRLHGHDAAVSIDGPLRPHIDWADIVVGPVNSGAMVESISAGRPYFAMRNRPTSMESELYAGAIVFDSVGELTAALKSGLMPDGAAMFPAFLANIDATAADVWDAIERGVAA